MKPTAFLLLAGMVWAAPPPNVNAQLPWHRPVVDGTGKLLAWSEPEKNRGYDKVLRLGWDFIKNKVPKDTTYNTGQKIYLVNAVFDYKTLQGKYWQHNPAMVYASFVDSLVAWYPYSADAEAIATVKEMLDYQLARGTTPLDWKWPGVPFATSCEGKADYGGCIQNMPHEFYGGIETDKVAELGTGYTLFYELTGDKKYLDAALRCANALAKYVRPGDEEHTPWRFRVDARTGVVLAGEEYGGNIVAAVRMFDELIRLKAGDTAAYKKARDLAWDWLRKYPLNVSSKAWDKWSGYFEDVQKNLENVNQVSPGMTAHYILSRENPADVYPNWVIRVGHLLDWVRTKFARGPYFGAWAIDEQGTPDGRGCCSRSGLSSHTSRWAAMNALYAEKTGDGQAREDAIRSMNYATYFSDDEGRISCCGVGSAGEYWFSDGYGDYLRHLQWIMGALPETAPVGANHILRSSSVVRKVQYRDDGLDYGTFDAASTEVLRLNFAPKRVTAGAVNLAMRQDLSAEGYTLEPIGGDVILRVRHAASGAVEIRK